MNKKIGLLLFIVCNLAYCQILTMDGQEQLIQQNQKIEKKRYCSLNRVVNVFAVIGAAATASLAVAAIYYANRYEGYVHKIEGQLGDLNNQVSDIGVQVANAEATGVALARQVYNVSDNVLKLCYQMCGKCVN
jgi:cell division protein FtsL